MRSLFVTPDDQVVPPCVNGFALDRRKRCVEIIEVDKEAHEKFLIEMLSNRFQDDYEYENEEDDEPLKLEIPIQVAADYLEDYEYD